jgi:Fic family protein
VILRQPLLYLSLYFKKHRDEYFNLLTKVRLEGDWEAWLKFFAAGVREMAEGAVATAHSLNVIFDEDRRAIRNLGRKAGSALRVHQVLQSRPLASAPFLAQAAKMSAPTVAGALEALQKEGIVREVTGRKRKRIYAYWKYLEIMNKGTES